MKRTKKKLFSSERELAECIVIWLTANGWEVFKEVKPEKMSAIADIVAKRNDKIWIIETKLVYGSKVLEQAYNWLEYADFVSIAVPRMSKSNVVLEFFIKEKGIGRFWVSPSFDESTSHGYVHLNLNPKVNEPKYDNVKRSLREEHKLTIAGSLSGEAFTPYKATIKAVKEHLVKNGPSTIHSIVDNIKHHYSNRNSAINTLSKRLIEVEDEYKVIFDNNGTKLFALK